MNPAAVAEQKTPLKPGDYKSDLKSIWCPGCGDFGVAAALYRAFAELQIPSENLAVVSGIGCSSRLPGYVNAYGFNTIHGRAIPIATGLKLSRPDLTVVVGSGDGDAFSIGAGHLPHVARRNVDITLIVMDNNTYGLTKGQMSPTTPINNKTASTLYGSIDQPVNPIPMALSYGAGFIARGFSGQLSELAHLLTRAIQHKGFSFVQVLSPCPTFRGDNEYDRIREIIKPIPESHDIHSWQDAMKLATETSESYLGVFYENEKNKSYGELIENQRTTATTKKVPDIAQILNKFK